MPQRSLHTWGSRCNLAPIVFHEGRDFVSCFKLTSSWSSALVHGRNGGSRSIRRIWLENAKGCRWWCMWIRCKCESGRARRCGGCGGGWWWDTSIHVMIHVIMGGCGSGCCIAIGVVRIEATRWYFWDDGKRAGTATSFSCRYTSVWDWRGLLSFLRLWVVSWARTLFGSNRNRDCGSNGGARRNCHRWGVRIGIRDWIHCDGWVTGGRRCAWSRIGFSVVWRMQCSRT